MTGNYLRRIRIVCVLIFGFGIHAFSQEGVAMPDFCSNWYLEAGAGAQIFFAKDVSGLDFDKRITPSFSLAGGKWFSPFWGARVRLQGYGLNGYRSTDGLFLDDALDNGYVYGTNDPVRRETTIYPDGSYRFSLRYLNVHADFRLQLLNLITGYDEANKWEIVPGIGLGYAHLFEYKGTPDGNYITANFSVAGKYRLLKNMDVNLEVSSFVVPDQFDGRISGKIYENNLSLTAGITYFLNKKPFKKREVEYVSTEVIKPIEVIKIVRDTVFQTMEINDDARIIASANPFVLSSIRFDKGESVPLKHQEVQYENIANYMKQHSLAKVRLNGYADKETGSPEYNKQLSVRRATVVRDVLINDYRVDAARIEAHGEGIDEQPYHQNDWNRVVTATVVQ